MPVVVEEDGAVGLGHGSDEKVDGGRAAMVASLRKRCLRPERKSLGPDVERKGWKQVQRLRQLSIVGRAPRRVEELERHWGAKRQGVLLEERRPAGLDLTASVPGARVSEVEGHLEDGEADELLRARDRCLRRVGFAP